MVRCFRHLLFTLTAYWWGVVGVLIGVGCGGSKEDPQTRADLMDIVVTYHMFSSEHERGPRHMEELLAFQDPFANSLPGNAAIQQRVKQVLQSGNYVVIWDVEILTPSEKNAGMILAYHRDVPEKGGYVCYQDGTPAVLTREEFERTPKSQPTAKSNK